MTLIDQGGTDKAKCRQGRVMALHEVDLPFYFSGLAVEADQEVTHAPDIKVFPIEDGSGTDPTAVFPGKEGNTHRTFPLGFPVWFPALLVKGTNDFFLSLGFHGEYQVVG